MTSKLITYLEARLGERSTWAGIGAALTGTVGAVAALQEPQGVVVALTVGIAACGVIAALLPAPGGKSNG